MPSNEAPKYRVVEQRLRALLAELPHGELLPTEARLCQEHGVSRITVRRALEELEREGLIRRRRGHGTTVVHEDPALSSASTDQGEHFDDHFTGFHGQLTGFGHRVTSDVLELGPVRASQQVARGLGVARNEEIMHLSRLRFVDGSVHQLALVWFRKDRFPGIEEEDFSERSLFGYLGSEHAVVFSQQDISVSLTLPTRDQARLLGTPADQPRLSIELVGSTADGEPVLFGQDIFASPNAHVSFTTTASTPPGHRD